MRDLRGVIEREHAEIGVLVSLGKPTDKMRAEAATAGFYKSLWGQHPKLQLLQVDDILQGTRVDCPPLRQVNVTFKKAGAAPASPEAETEAMFDVPVDVDALRARYRR